MLIRGMVGKPSKYRGQGPSEVRTGNAACGGGGSFEEITRCHDETGRSNLGVARARGRMTTSPSKVNSAKEGKTGSPSGAGGRNSARRRSIRVSAEASSLAEAAKTSPPPVSPTCPPLTCPPRSSRGHDPSETDMSPGRGVEKRGPGGASGSKVRAGEWKTRKEGRGRAGEDGPKTWGEVESKEAPGIPSASRTESFGRRRVASGGESGGGEYRQEEKAAEECFGPSEVLASAAGDPPPPPSLVTPAPAPFPSHLDDGAYNPHQKNLFASSELPRSASRAPAGHPPPPPSLLTPSQVCLVLVLGFSLHLPRRPLFLIRPHLRFHSRPCLLPHL